MSGSVVVSPSEIKRTIQPGEHYEEALTVRNVGDERGSFSVQAEKGFQDWVDADPDLFVINAQDARAVALVLKTDKTKIGRNSFIIEVIHEENADDHAEVEVTLIRPRFASHWGIALAAIMILLALIGGAFGLLGV